MSNGEITPYVQQKPGDLITAENWNQMQIDVKKDIQSSIGTAVGQIRHASTADTAGDAEKLGGKDLSTIEQEIVKSVLGQIHTQTGSGYMRLFKRLKTGEERIITHNLGTFPLSDVLQLDYFPVVCPNPDIPNQQTAKWVNMYLYHSGEGRQHFQNYTIDIEPRDGQPYMISFATLLDQLDIHPPDTMTLEDLVWTFWKALLPYAESPTINKTEFDSDQYCHSPWFDRCCGENRTVQELKGEWSQLYLKMCPRKTINYPIQDTQKQNPPQPPQAAPTQIQIVHYDLNTLGIMLLSDPAQPESTTQYQVETLPRPQYPADELKVMLLLKV